MRDKFWALVQHRHSLAGNICREESAERARIAECLKLFWPRARRCQRQNLPASSRHGLPLGRARDRASFRKFTAYQTLARSDRGGMCFADMAARPFGLGHERASNYLDSDQGAAAR